VLGTRLLIWNEPFAVVQEVGAVIADIVSAGTAVTTALVVVGSEVKPLEVTVALYVPALAEVMLVIVNTPLALDIGELVKGPFRVYDNAGYPVTDGVTVTVSEEPGHTGLLVTTFGGGGVADIICTV
jgi:hypothetical protein